MTLFLSNMIFPIYSYDDDLGEYGSYFSCVLFDPREESGVMSSTMKKILVSPQCAIPKFAL